MIHSVLLCISVTRTGLPAGRPVTNFAISCTCSGCLRRFNTRATTVEEAAQEVYQSVIFYMRPRIAWLLKSCVGAREHNK